MPDFVGLLRRLAEAEVDFVLVGGLAAVAHGSSLATQDVDVCIRLGAENLGRLQRALFGLEPTHRTPTLSIPFEHDTKTLDSFRNVYLRTRFGQLDCLGEVLGVGTFAEVKAQSIEIDLNGTACRVISLDALIAAKAAMGREQDRLAVEQLLKIKSLRSPPPQIIDVGSGSGVPDQLSLPGINPPLPQLDRLFLALFPPSLVASQIAGLASQWRREHGMRGEPLATDRFHVTLVHIDDFVGVPQGVVRDICEAVKTISSPPFDVRFDCAVSFSRAFVLKGGEGVAALNEFRHKLFLALQRAGVRCRSGPIFTPHVTLLYDDRIVPEHRVAPVSWTVNEFVLVHSLLGRTKYVRLARFPLQNS